MALFHFPSFVRSLHFVLDNLFRIALERNDFHMLNVTSMLSFSFLLTLPLFPICLSLRFYVRFKMDGAMNVVLQCNVNNLCLESRVLCYKYSKCGIVGNLSFGFLFCFFSFFFVLLFHSVLTIRHGNFLFKTSQR